jgi:endonuclease/exonuclease/phosphatase family metal-dependent hydrolase
MTFNLLTSTKKQRSHPWRLRRRSIARIFQRYQPDVVGTQEANLAQLRELAELLPDYDFLGESNLAGTVSSESVRNWYCAIFYRRDRVRPAEDDLETIWLSPTPEVPASQFHLGTRPRILTWNTFEHIPSRQVFLFGTTHLEAINGLHRQKSTVLIRDRICEKVRQYGNDMPLFLTGDFNAREESREIRNLCYQNGDACHLYDAWLEAGTPDPVASETFAGLGVKDRLGKRLLGPRRIDYVFYRPQLPILDVKRVDFGNLVSRDCARPSDHFPVVADFALNV